MSKRLKQVRAGRLVSMVCYTAVSAGDGERTRMQKRKASTLARELLNARTSFQKLERLLAANFDDGDLLVTFTFDDKHRPGSREETVKKARCFWPKLRAARRDRGEDLLYVYVPEGHCPAGRPHIHAVVNSTGEDMEEIRRLWRYGGNVDFKVLKFTPEFTYADLASYLTKEPREWGHPCVGERTWIPSLGLRRPEEPPAETVPDYMTLTAPPEAFTIECEGPRRNGYGEFSWIKYLLPVNPDRAKARPKRHRRRKKE